MLSLLLAPTDVAPFPALAAVLLMALWLAVAIDRCWGEPPPWCHPVVGMGCTLGWCGARVRAFPPSGGFAAGTLRIEAVRTPSPNSGWPMAAMALALGVRLRKPGVYVLNAAGRAPQPVDTLRAVQVCSRAVAILAALVLPILGLVATGALL